MKALYLDCFAGISGNMLLGAFLDAGVPEVILREELAKLKLTGYELKVQQVDKVGISAMYADVELMHHHHHHHRHLPDIFAIIDKSGLEQSVKDDSKKVFLRLAEAEAKVHGTSIEKIHFHEVGAIDSIVDIVGSVFCLHYLGIKRVFASRLHTGNGFVRCSHGSMPIPAPATAELLMGIPWYSGNTGKELVTPTGAAFLAVFGCGYGELPEGFKVHSIAYGAGGWDLEFPNVLRMHLGEWEQSGSEGIHIVEANIDDLNPQVYSYVMDKLLATGALDVWLTPIIMKKSRPAVTLSVMITAKQLEAIAAIIFTETTTIGIRYYEVNRIIADRFIERVQTVWGEAAVKISKYQDEICTVSPEYEDCRTIAEQNGLPLKKVQHHVLEQALQLKQS